MCLLWDGLLPQLATLLFTQYVLVTVLKILIEQLLVLDSKVKVANSIRIKLYTPVIIPSCLELFYVSEPSRAASYTFVAKTKMPVCNSRTALQAFLYVLSEISHSRLYECTH